MKKKIEITPKTQLNFTIYIKNLIASFSSFFPIQPKTITFNKTVNKSYELQK